MNHFKIETENGKTEVNWELTIRGMQYFEQASGVAINEFYDAAQRREFRLSYWTAILWAGCKAGANLNGTPFEFSDSYEDFLVYLENQKYTPDQIVTEGMRLMGFDTKNLDAPKKQGAKKE